jgi:hypothetical protein
MNMGLYPLQHGLIIPVVVTRKGHDDRSRRCDGLARLVRLFRMQKGAWITCSSRGQLVQLDKNTTAKVRRWLSEQSFE